MFTTLPSPILFDGTLRSSIQRHGLLTGCRLILDAGDAASYSSGQSWLDRSGGSYDFFLGTTSGSENSDPTFNGTAGGKSASEYWSFDGGDNFRYDSTNETWMEDTHKNNAAFSIMVCWMPQLSAGNQALAGTRGAAGTIGFDYHISSSEKQRIVIEDSGTELDVSTTDSITAASVTITGISIDEATGAGGGFFYKNGAFDQVSGADTFNCTYASPTGNAAAATMEIAARGGGDNRVVNNTRIYWFAMWGGRVLTKPQMDLIYNDLRSRVGL